MEGTPSCAERSSHTVGMEHNKMKAALLILSAMAGVAALLVFFAPPSTSQQAAPPPVFDTLEVKNSLVQAGFDEPKASALVIALQAAAINLATNAAITAAVSDLETRMLKWFASTALTLVTIVLAAIALRRPTDGTCAPTERRPPRLLDTPGSENPRIPQ